ncbi:MAG: DUF4440 domain-containing protein [Pseudomonadota bacterium]
MKKFGWGVLLAVLMGATSEASAAEPLKLTEAGAIFNQWIAGYQAHNADKLMAVFDKSLIYSSQGEGDQTYDELKASYVTFFASRMPPTRWKAIPKEIQAGAGLAVVVSIWEQRSKTGSGPEEVVARIRSVDVFRQTKAGWKIVRTINYPEQN